MGWLAPLAGALVALASAFGREHRESALSARGRHGAGLAHRIVWLKPLKGATARDTFASGHNLASLETLGEQLAR